MKIFTGRYGFGGGLTIPNYSVSPDGSQFFMIKEQSRASQTSGVSVRVPPPSTGLLPRLVGCASTAP
jgi:hypothetical protein